MAKNLTSYKDWLGDKLADPNRAARYLNAALEDSQVAFLKALRKVSDSCEKKQLAETAGVSRESLYRMLSDVGNPTLSSLDGILHALGFKITVEPIKLKPAEGSKVGLSHVFVSGVVHAPPAAGIASGADLGRMLRAYFPPELNIELQELTAENSTAKIDETVGKIHLVSDNPQAKGAIRATYSAEPRLQLMKQA